LNDLTIGTRAKLFNNDITPSASDGLGDYTEAEFGGFSVVTASHSAASVSDGEAKNVLSPSTVFAHDDGGSGNVRHGFYVPSTNAPSLHPL
jgi:hypothetical protein